MKRRFFSDSNGVFSPGDVDHWVLVWLDVKTEWDRIQEAKHLRKRLEVIDG